MESSTVEKKPRYLTEVDLLKFIAIAGMVIIHIYENWTGTSEVSPYPTTAVDVFIQFLGGPVCAPLFMLACGIGVIYTRSNRPIDYLNRGLILLVTAYILSFLRSYVAAAAEGLSNDQLLLELLNVDILHLAGLAFILIGILRALRCNRWHVLILAIAMFAISNLVGIVPVDGLTGYVVGLFFFTQCGDVCFPLFEWFIYIAVGVFLGSYLRGSTDHPRMYKGLFVLGLLMFVIVTIESLVTGFDLRDFFTLYANRFYQQSFLALAWILGIVFMCMSAAYFALSAHPRPRFDSLCHFFGKNLNRIYIMQWIIVGNVSAVIAYSGVTIAPILAIPLGILLLAGVSLLVPTYIKGVEFLRSRVSENTGSF
ncbi:MAG: DUF1624 domain-containing protein [archaeon]|nr:DUF1624 domain-containing protein [archaeon]